MSSIVVRHDLRHLFGPVRDQEGRETCLAFATSDAHAVAIGGMWSPLSCEYLFYHAKLRDKTPADQGTTISAIQTALEQDGQPVEAGWPYLIALPVDLKQWKPPANVGPLFRRTSNSNGKPFDEIWNVVEADKPVLVGMTISDAFAEPDGDGVIDSEEPVGPVTHAVLVVGTGTREKKKLLFIRNSWGDDWGLSGYGWMSEQYAICRIKVALTIN